MRTYPELNLKMLLFFVCRCCTYSWSSRRVRQRTEVMLCEVHSEDDREQSQINCMFLSKCRKLQIYSFKRVSLSGLAQDSKQNKLQILHGSSEGQTPALNLQLALKWCREQVDDVASRPHAAGICCGLSPAIAAASH